MLEAYIGTIDYENETLGDAIAEVSGWLAGEGTLSLRIPKKAKPLPLPRQWLCESIAGPGPQGIGTTNTLG